MRSLPQAIKRKHLAAAALAIIAITATTLITHNEEPTPFTLTLPPTNPQDMTTEQRLEDYEYLYAMVESNYPYLKLKERTHGTSWLDRKASAQQKIRDATTNREFLEIIIEEVNALQNRHTHVTDPNTVQQYQAQYRDWAPMNQVFTEQVAEANQNWRNPYYDITYTKNNARYDVEIVYDMGEYILATRQGSRETQYGTNLTVTKVNGTPIHQAITTCNAYIDHDHKRGKPYVWAITPGCFGPDAVFTTRDPDGDEANHTFPTVLGAQPRTNFYPAPNLMTTKHPNISTAYIYLKTFDPSTVRNLYPEIHGFLKEVEDYSYLIIDIRGNTGGSFTSWIEALVEPLLREDTTHEYYLAYRDDPYIQSFHSQWLTTHQQVPKTRLQSLPPEAQGPGYTVYDFSSTYTATHHTSYNGQTILLTDRTVYSAAEGFTNFCKQTGFATIVGTTSGGDGFYVWPLYLVLPHSKLVVTMTSSMSLDRQGRANEEARTQPDIYIETSITDHNKLIDHVLHMIETGTFPG
jgi:hypothetical protein